MAAKAAHKAEITEFKYGGDIRLSVRNFEKIGHSSYVEVCTQNAHV